MQCIICGKELTEEDKEKLKNKNGNIIYICKECNNGDKY